MTTETQADTDHDAEPYRAPDLSAFTDAVDCGLSTVADLERSLEGLDALLLTGRPHAIADAATALELSLAAAAPAFQRIAQTMDAIGTDRLQDAALKIRPWDPAAALSIDSLRVALKQFARRNDACYRRAQSLVRGLTASLRTLHALGLAGNGRLIAEA